MKYLVLRSNAIQRKGSNLGMLGSSCFPIEVETRRDGIAYTAEDIVRMAFDQINEGYVGLHEYIVVPMYVAQVVNFRCKPRPEYEVVTSPYDC